MPVSWPLGARLNAIQVQEMIIVFGRRNRDPGKIILDIRFRIVVKVPRMFHAHQYLPKRRGRSLGDEWL
jgi:hypothetical protein